MFIDCKIELIFDQVGLASIHNIWHFDQMSSSMILNDYDKDQNSKLNKKETASLQKEMFDNLKNHNYFNYITIKGQKFKVKQIKKFDASIQDGQLVYSFEFPCRVIAADSYKKVRISIFDPTFYSKVQLSDKPLDFSGAESFSVKRNISKAPSLSYYHDRVVPRAITLRIKK
mgnify:CR=1 FL=1